MRAKLLGAGLVLALVSSCTSTQLQQAQSGVQLACIAAQADLQLAQQQPGATSNATVQNLASYVNGGCPVVEGAVTVAANVAADPNGTKWVQGLQAGINAAAAATAPVRPPAAPVAAPASAPAAS